MLSSYLLNERQIRQAEDGNVIVLQNTTDAEERRLADRYGLPEDLFAADEEAVEVTRFEALVDTKLADAHCLVVMDLAADTRQPIEARLQPVTIVASAELLLIHFAQGSTLWASLLERDLHPHGFDDLLGELILRAYVHFLLELEATKAQIDALDQAARRTTENQELFNLADTMRKVIFLDHTLQDMRGTVAGALDAERFLAHAPTLAYQVQLRQRQAEKMVALYRDLLETIGGLFSDMMDNNLNHLMKYLDSAGLVISVPALVSGLWGMNAGGLPGKDSTLGFMIVFGVALLLGVLTAVHLARKDYSR